MPEDYEEGAALRALTEVQKSLPSRDDLEKTVESEAEEVARLQATLAEMQAESERLEAVLELEEMKKMLLERVHGMGLADDPSSQPPRSAWGEPPPQQQQQQQQQQRRPLVETQQRQHGGGGGGGGGEEDSLTAADEARLARLMAEEDEFDAMPPSEMAATLARMEAELGQLKMQSEAQSQVQELDRLKAELAREQTSLEEDAAKLSGLKPGILLK